MDIFCHRFLAGPVRSTMASLRFSSHGLAMKAEGAALNKADYKNKIRYGCVMIFSRIRISLLFGFICTYPVMMLATENGADSYPSGAEGVLAGALPPPGFYGQTFYVNYHASRFVDKHGDSMIPGFGLNLNGVVERLIYMTETTVMNGQLGFYVAQPFFDLRIAQGGQRGDRKGISDTLAAVMVGWHNGEHHWAAAIEGVFPTGEYDRDRMVNLGKNYYTLRPIVVYSYSQPDGWDLSTKLSYSFNTENQDTDYLSGQYFAGDFSLGYRFAPGWILALQGYAFKQLTSDESHGHKVGFRGQSLALGPGIQYQGKGWSLEGKYTTETAVENRPQGNYTWLKLTLAF
ncbi:SphA family protein [Azotobacter vinelandii]